MVNPVKVEGLVRTLRQYLTHLENLQNLGQDAVRADPYKRAAARYYLQISIESCIDIGNHVIASEKLRSPATHRETFEVLNEAGLIPDDLSATLQKMASMRNRLVHLYSEVDDDIVFKATSSAPVDCESFVRLVLDYMQAEN